LTVLLFAIQLSNQVFLQHQRKKLELPGLRIWRVLPFGAICDGNSQSRIQHHLWYRLDSLGSLTFSSTHIVGRSLVYVVAHNQTSICLLELQHNSQILLSHLQWGLQTQMLYCYHMFAIQQSTRKRFPKAFIFV
jgi:hypothetical protein